MAMASAFALLAVLAAGMDARAETATANAPPVGAEQAARGGGLYATHCAACHGKGLEGGTAIALSGATFRTRWGDGQHSVDNLLYITRTQMPYGKPETLAPDGYLDLVAFILTANGYAAGPQPLPLDAKILGAIIIAPR
jgi:mono/diheme cytochrome c family protein